MTIADKLDYPLTDKDTWLRDMAALAATVDEHTRIAVAVGLLAAIVDHALEGGSFRYLIYSRMGFTEDAYLPLLMAGGMDVSNEFLMVPHPERSAAIDELEAIAAQAPMMPSPAITKADGTPLMVPTKERLRLFAALNEFRDVQAALLAERRIREKVEAELAEATSVIAQLRSRQAAFALAAPVKD